MSAGRLNVDDYDAVAEFIRSNTRLLAPPLTPEIVLHLADESVPIWQKTEDELGEINVPPPYWAFAWSGGQALARYVIDNPELCRGKSVVDLGAGSGLGAIAAIKSGAFSALAADVDAMALVACRLNAAANDVEVSTTAGDLLKTGVEADVVLIGDLFYERELADRVIGFIAAQKAAGVLVLIGDPQRSYFPRQRFEQLFAYSVPVTRELEDAEIKTAIVWRA